MVKDTLGHALTVCAYKKNLLFHYRLTLVANNASPAIRAVTAIALHITNTTIRTVFACQTAVMAKCVVQAHCVVLSF